MRQFKQEYYICAPIKRIGILRREKQRRKKLEKRSSYETEYFCYSDLLMKISLFHFRRSFWESLIFRSDESMYAFICAAHNYALLENMHPCNFSNTMKEFSTFHAIHLSCISHVPPKALPCQGFYNYAYVGCKQYDMSGITGIITLLSMRY